MKFTLKEATQNQKKSLIYNAEEYSFNTEPHIESSGSSLIINDLQLEIDPDGKVLHAWGYCPLIDCEETNEVPNNYNTRDLIAVLEEALIPGISYRVNKDNRWPVYVIVRKGGCALETQDLRQEK